MVNTFSGNDILILLPLSKKHMSEIQSILEAIKKIRKNEKKYPVEKSINSARKYNEL